MTCAEVRRLGDSFLADALLVEANHEVLAHVRGCHACRSFLADCRVRGSLRGAWDRSQELAARPEFINSLAATLAPGASHARGRTPRWRRWPALAAAAVVITALGVAGQIGIGALRWSALVHAAAGDHRDCAVAFRLRERPISLEEAAQRLDPAFESLAALELPSSGPRGSLRVLERHACLFEGRWFAHLVLRYDGRLVSVVIGDGHRPWFGPSTQQVGDFSVAAFSASRHAVLLVAALDSQATLELARAVVPPVSRALSGS